MGRHVEEQKDLVTKHKDSIKKHENTVKKNDDLVNMYENLSKKYKELETQHRHTVEQKEDLIIKHGALSDKYEEIENKYKNVVKKHEQLVQQLKDKVECPVCLAVPNKPPIPVCPNGHVVCTKCVRDDCPKCRVKMKQGKSTLAVTVIENLDHQCENERCQEIIPFDGLASHVKNCNYRLVTCPYLRCGVKISLSSVATHMVSSSCIRDKIEVHELPHAFLFTYKSDDQLNDVSEWKPNAMRFGQQIFICKVARYIVNGNGRWFFLVQMVGGAEATAGYRVTIIVHRPEDGPEGSYSQIYNGDVCPIDLTSMESAEEKGLCLLLTDWAMEKLLVGTNESDSKRKFSVSVNLFGIDPAMS